MNKWAVLGYALTFLAFGAEITLTVVRGTFGLLDVIICVVLAAAAVTLLVGLSKKRPAP